MAANDLSHAYAPRALEERPSGYPRPTSPLTDPAIAPAVTTTSSASLEAFKDITFGSLAGICGKFIEYPFDTVKVRLQSHVPSSLSPPYRGPLDCFVRSYRYDGGLASLYRGISAPLFGAAIETSSLFFSYRLAQEALVHAVPSLRTSSLEDTASTSTKTILPFSALILCGAASGAFTSLLLTPIELIKCRMQVPSSTTGKRPSPMYLILQTFRNEGFLGFWHGQLGTLIRETGGSAAWFGSYEGICRAFKSYHQKTSIGPAVEENADLPLYQQLLAGAAAGMSYNFIFYPADTIKSRMQTEEIAPSSSSSRYSTATTKSSAATAPTKKQTFASTGRAIWQDQGLRGFYRGCGITVARAAPSSAFIFAIYEGLRARFG